MKHFVTEIATDDAQVNGNQWLPFLGVLRESCNFIGVSHENPLKSKNISRPGTVIIAGGQG